MDCLVANRQAAGPVEQAIKADGIVGIAQVWPTSGAIGALAAVWGEGEDDVIARPGVGDTSADGLDDRAGLVAEDERQRRGPFTLDDMVVTMADTSGGDPNERLTWFRSASATSSSHRQNFAQDSRRIRIGTSSSSPGTTPSSRWRRMGHRAPIVALGLSITGRA
jgi:hypothetical protein